MIESLWIKFVFAGQLHSWLTHCHMRLCLNAKLIAMLKPACWIVDLKLVSLLSKNGQTATTAEQGYDECMGTIRLAGTIKKSILGG